VMTIFAAGGSKSSVAREASEDVSRSPSVNGACHKSVDVVPPPLEAVLIDSPEQETSEGRTPRRKSGGTARRRKRKALRRNGGQG
jgi:hypothetical protein